MYGMLQYQKLNSILLGYVFSKLFFFSLCFRHKHQKSLPVTALAWNPSKNNELAFCDNQVKKKKILKRGIVQLTRVFSISYFPPLLHIFLFSVNKVSM